MVPRRQRVSPSWRYVGSSNVADNSRPAVTHQADENRPARTRKNSSKRWMGEAGEGSATGEDMRTTSLSGARAGQGSVLTGGANQRKINRGWVAAASAAPDQWGGR